MTQRQTAIAVATELLRRRAAMLYEKAAASGVELFINEAGRLQGAYKQGAMSDALRDEIKESKSALIWYLSRSESDTIFVIDRLLDKVRGVK